MILLCEESEGPVEGLCRSYVYRLEYALKFSVRKRVGLSQTLKHSGEATAVPPTPRAAIGVDQVSVARTRNVSAGKK